MRWLPLVFLVAGVSQAQLPELSSQNFGELHAMMQPTEEELVWKSIPWHTNLWDARREAAETGKPIYLWEMDGHPLGCT